MVNTELRYTDEEAIKALLVGRKVVEVKDATLILDNGTELVIIPNDGCWGCSSGNYWLDEINDCPNAITNVKFKDSDGHGSGDSLEVFVYAEHKKINLYTVKGDVGNGYYGAGYTIRVQVPE